MAGTATGTVTTMTPKPDRASRAGWNCNWTSNSPALHPRQSEQGLLELQLPQPYSLSLAELAELAETATASTLPSIPGRTCCTSMVWPSYPPPLPRSDTVKATGAGSWQTLHLSLPQSSPDQLKLQLQMQTALPSIPGRASRACNCNNPLRPWQSEQGLLELQPQQQ